MSVEDTEIIMADGSLKKIQDIQIGDSVVTLLGTNEVTQTWDPDTLAEGEPECFEITFEDGSSVVCSDKHQFLIDGKWIKAEDLEIGAECTTTLPIIKRVTLIS